MRYYFKVIKSDYWVDYYWTEMKSGMYGYYVTKQGYDYTFTYDRSTIANMVKDGHSYFNNLRFELIDEDEFLMEQVK